MNVEIPCETFLRLAEIPAHLATTDKRKYLNSIYIERKNNSVILFATNGRVAAIENIGEQPGPDGGFAMTVANDLKAQCEIEAKFGGKISVQFNEALNYANINTMMGFKQSGNGCVSLPVGNALQTWRTLIPQEFPTQSNGFMYISATDLYVLATASPSGGLIFPEFIDINIPSVIRDPKSPNWFGLFRAIGADNEPSKYANLPTWVR